MKRVTLFVAGFGLGSLLQGWITLAVLASIASQFCLLLSLEESVEC